MKNPFKPDRSAQDRDNPVVPNVVERPAERAADRAAMHDNPLVPNAIERPVERAVADDRGAGDPWIVDRWGMTGLATGLASWTIRQTSRAVRQRVRR